MRMIIDGHPLPVKSLDSARIRDVMDLQQQTGWKLSELREQTADNASINAAVLTFLTMRAGGLETTWDEVLDRSFNDIKVVAEPGDRRAAEADKPDPPQPSGASAPDDAAPEEVAPTED